MNDEQLRAWQDRLAHPIIQWTLKGRDVMALLDRGFWLAASGWTLHIESMS